MGLMVMKQDSFFLFFLFSIIKITLPGMRTGFVDFVAFLAIRLWFVALQPDSKCPAKILKGQKTQKKYGA